MNSPNLEEFMSISVPKIPYSEIITPAVRATVEKNPHLKAADQAGVIFLCDVSDAHDQQVEVNIYPENSEQNSVLLARLDTQFALMKIKTELLRGMTDIRGKLQNCFQREAMEGDIKGPFYDYFLLNDLSEGIVKNLLALMAVFDNDIELNDATRRNIPKFEQYLRQYQKILQSEPLIMAAQSLNEVNTLRQEAGITECAVESLLAEHSEKISVTLPNSYKSVGEEGVSEKKKQRKWEDLDLAGVEISSTTRSNFINRKYLSDAPLSQVQRRKLQDAFNDTDLIKVKKKFDGFNIDPLMAFHDCLISKHKTKMLCHEVSIALPLVSIAVSKIFNSIRKRKFKNREDFEGACKILIKYFLLFINTAFERLLRSDNIEEIRFISEVIDNLLSMLSVQLEVIQHDGIHPKIDGFSSSIFRVFLAGLENKIPISEAVEMLHMAEIIIYNGGTENNISLVKDKQKARTELGFLMRRWMTDVLEYTKRRRDQYFPQAISAELPISLGLSFVSKDDKQ